MSCSSPQDMTSRPCTDAHMPALTQVALCGKKTWESYTASPKSSSGWPCQPCTARPTASPTASPTTGSPR
eukprot:scaffold323075_cov19-Tisochrysis_lutea.AAC.1